jgi:hypothetical protein
MRKERKINTDQEKSWHLPAPGMAQNPFTATKLEEANQIVAFGDNGSFERAIAELLRKGFLSEQISIERVEKGNLLDSTLLNASKIMQGAGLGALIGIFLGFVLAISGTVGPGIFEENSISQVIATSVLSGILFCIIGALIGLSIHEYRSEKYRTKIKDGSILVHIHHPEKIKVAIATKILKDYGGENAYPNQRMNNSRIAKLKRYQ